MGFNDEYLKLRKKRLGEAEQEADKKAENKTFTDTYNELRNERLATTPKDTRSDLLTIKARGVIGDSFDDNSWKSALADLQTKGDEWHTSMAEKRRKAEEEKADNSGWFTAGAFDDGYDFGDITRTILGTTTDFVDDIVGGAAETVEGVIDAVATGAGVVGGLFGADEFQDDMASFVADDLINGEAVGDVVGYVNPLKWGNAILNGGDDEAYSILGDKLDGSVQSIGQYLTAAGLQLVGVPWWLTTGAQVLGSETEQALNEGATFGEASLYGAINSATSVGLTKLGGVAFGGKTLSDKVLQPFVQGISSKTGRALVNLGIDAAGEGFEELLESLVSRISSKIYKDESIGELLTSEEAVDEYITSFISGAIVGGGIESVNAVRSGVKGRDYKTGLTDNEQKVYNKVLESEIAKAEEGGKTLTSKEKAKIEEQVKRDLQKGFISTDTIEEVLGEDTYKAYKDAVAYEDAIKKEYAELGSKEYLDPAEYERYTELGKLIEEADSKQLKADADKSFAELLKKDTYLQNSYAERVRRSQSFDADLSQYKDENARKTVENAIKYGMHNGTDAHEFVDFAAKLAAKKGYVVDFTNTRMLKDSIANGNEYNLEAGAERVEAFVSESKKKIVLNMDAEKSRSSLFGHELTHTLETAKAYDQLQKYIFEYAKQKGEYDSRLSDIEGRYSKVTADVQKELTADLCGDYLLTDYDFISQLATKDRNVFQKVYDEIKYMFKLATTGSKEARALEKAKHYYEKALREATKADKAAEGNKYSLSDSDGKKLTKEQSEFFKDSKMRDENGNLKVMYHGSQDAGFHVFDPNMSDDDTSFFFVDRNDVAASYSGTTETYEAQTIRTAEDMNNFLAEIGYDQYEAVERNGKYELLENNEHVAWSDTAQGIYEEFCWYEGVGEGDANYKVYLNLTNPLEIDAKGRPWNKIDAEFSQEVYDKYNSLTDGERAALIDLAEWEDFRLFNSEIQEASGNELASAYAKMGEDVNIYDLFSVAADNFSEESMRENSRRYLKTRDFAQRAKEQGYDGVIFKNLIDNGGYSNGSEGASTVAIAFNSEQIKSVANATPTSDPDIRYSLSADSQGRELSKGQREYFRQSKVVDENGNLRVMYHGTPSGKFTVFKDGTYFTANKWYADLYQNPGASSISTGKVATDPKTYEVYLDIKKPFDIDDAEARRIYINDYIKGGNAVGINPYLSDAEYAKISSIDWTEGEDLRDFLVENGYDYDGLVLDEGATGGYGDDVKYRGKSYVIFNPEQVKNVDNKTPTSDPDIRFSLSKSVEETKDLMALHNLKAGELLKSLDLGGLPMPSIAVIKAEAGHEQYGDVSLIIPKDAIDPKKNKANKVYGGDAWTPTYPRIEYKPRKSVEDKISKKYYDLAHKIGYDDVRPLYRYVHELEDVLNRSGGEAGMLNEIYNDTGIMQVYLADTGKGKVETVQKEIRTELSDVEVERNEYFINALGADVVDAVMARDGQSPMEHRTEYWKEHGEKIKETCKRLLAEEYGLTDEQVQNVLSAMKTYDFLKYVRDAYLYRKNGRVTTKTEPDISATNEAIKAAASDGYKEWVDGLFKGVEEKTGIRNNAGYFTNSGNRRSWDALHWENTLENVVRVMKQQKQTGADAIFGASQLFAVSAKDYRSIADVKADSDRLYKMSEDEYEAVKESYMQRMSDISNRIMDKGERNQFIALDNAMECIVDAVRSSKTAEGIYRELKQYSQLTVTEQDAADIAKLVNDIANMPTGYFEAKPQRAVGFDEVGVFVIPRNADVTLKQELLNRGYSIAEYDPDVEGDRQKVVNSFEEYKFSLARGTEKAYGNYNGKLRDLVLAPTAEVQEDIAPVAKDWHDVVNTMRDPELDEDGDWTQEYADYHKGIQQQLSFDMAGEVVADVDNGLTSEELKAKSDAALREYEEIQANKTQGEAYTEKEMLTLHALYSRYSFYDSVANDPTYVEKLRYSLSEDTDIDPQERLDSLTEDDMPPETIAPYVPEKEPITVDEKSLGAITQKVNEFLGLNAKDSALLADMIRDYARDENFTERDLHEAIRENFHYTEEMENDADEISQAKQHMRGVTLYIDPDYKGDFHGKNKDGYNAFRREHFGHFHLTTKPTSFALSVDSFYEELSEYFPSLFPADIGNVADRLQRMGEVADMEQETVSRSMEYDDDVIQEVVGIINNELTQYSQGETLRLLGESQKAFYKSLEAKDIAPTAEYVDEDGQIKMTPDTPAESKKARKKAEPKKETPKTDQERIAEILTEEPKTESKRNKRKWAIFKANVFDKGAVFEDVSLKRGNRELMGKWNYTLYSEARAQRFMGNGTKGVKSLNDIRAEVDGTGLTKQFYEYLYHLHNVDRMTLEERYEKAKNKSVFGEPVTANISRDIVAQFESKYPQFKEFAKDVYAYNKHLRGLLVEEGVISKETADLWEEMYPHYVPIRRVGDEGLNINVPLDTGKTGINAPVKRAKGGNRDILPLFDTMAQRTVQTFRAIAKNSFGVELKDTLGSTLEHTETNLDEVLDSIDAQGDLLQEGKDGRNPTFTVFENGEKVTFEITEDMYDALKPLSDSSFLGKTIKPLSVASNIHKGLLTEYNPVFMLTNGVKDIQDVMINSQHPAKTYAKMPEAYAQMVKKGYWYQEYMDNGGDQNSYFDNETNTFKTENKGLKKMLDLPPFSTVSKINNFIEMAPRLAEYIASREAGASVEVAMLDAARVTTNFKAGGDFTKFLNRNGATFLNASVQGAMQQIRNGREAKANGLRGVIGLATKFAVAGIPALILNNLVWDDDEDYEELSDYVKDDYYIVGKFGDGQFVRIPKGRTVAVIQDAVEQISNALTGDDEVDFKNTIELVISNLAPNNPFDNNILAPIFQVKNNETWYGEDLVPSRLQDLPAAEQYDESTDALSRWLGEKLDYSPYKINYLLNQYSGGLGDVFLPMLTPEAEGGDNSFLGNVLAPLNDKFTTDSVMNNQNVSDFYDLKTELTANAKSMNATEEDLLRFKYINTVNSELSELYKQKREIQNSDLPDDEKYEAARDIQKRIVALAENGLSSYDSVRIDGEYATVGNVHFRLNDNGEWTKLTDKQLESMDEVTSGLGIGASDYWENKTEYDFAYENPGKYAVANSVGGYDAYKTYSSELYDIHADKDEEGNSIRGSRKEKVIDYVSNLDVEYGVKCILFKSEYPADDTYNADILDYLNSREDLTYDDIKTILSELGFTVLDDGTVEW